MKLLVESNASKQRLGRAPTLSLEIFHLCTLLSSFFSFKISLKIPCGTNVMVEATRRGLSLSLCGSCYRYQCTFNDSPYKRARFR